jgi:hypothetical protein
MQTRKIIKTADDIVTVETNQQRITALSESDRRGGKALERALAEGKGREMSSSKDKNNSIKNQINDDYAVDKCDLVDKIEPQFCSSSSGSFLERDLSRNRLNLKSEIGLIGSSDKMHTLPDVRLDIVSIEIEESNKEKCNEKDGVIHNEERVEEEENAKKMRRKKHPLNKINEEVVVQQMEAVLQNLDSGKGLSSRYIRVPSGRFMGRIARVSQACSNGKYTLSVLNLSNESGSFHTTVVEGYINQYGDNPLNPTIEEEAAIRQEEFKNNLKSARDAIDYTEEIGVLLNKYVRVTKGIYMDRLGFVSLVNANGVYSITMLKTDDEGSFHTNAQGRNLTEVFLNDLKQDEQALITTHSEDRSKKTEEGHKRKERMDRIKVLNFEEENQEPEEKNMKKSFIGKYVRIYTGKYSDMIGRVTCTSSQKKSSINTLIILNSSNSHNNKHTTMASNKFEEIFDNDCNEDEKLLIKNNIEMLKQKKIEKFEKNEKNELLSHHQKEIEKKSENEKSHLDLIRPIKSMKEIPSDALEKDKYIRIKTGSFFFIV